MVSIQRLEKMSPQAIERIFTDWEREQMLQYAVPRRWEWLAGRFAVKEAVVKALGTGIAQGISWQDIETRINAQGAPQVFLMQQAAEKMHQTGACKVLVSIAHDGGFAIAMVQLAC